MKKTFLLLIAAAMVSTATLAQLEQKKDYSKERTEWENKVKTELKLSNDQIAKFDALNKEYNEKIELIALDANLSKEEQKEKKMALKKEKEGKLNEILTPEQQTKYKELMEKKKKEMSSKTARILNH